MEISNFELLIKRLAPGPSTQLNRRVVQGYFLSLTNLENRDLNIVIRVTVPSSSGTITPNIDRDFIPGQFGGTGFPTGSNGGLIFDNAPIAFNNRGITLLDISNIVNGSDGVTKTRVFQTPIVSVGTAIQNIPSIKAKQTVLLTLLPNTGLITATSNPNLEIRGFIEVYQLFGNDPAKIMISAEHRGTFLDNDFPTITTGEQDFDQITYPVALSHGRAIIEI